MYEVVTYESLNCTMNGNFETMHSMRQNRFVIPFMNWKLQYATSNFLF
jgi:hypothetical protein